MIRSLTAPPIPVMWTPESYLTSLCLKVFICKTGIIVPTSHSDPEIGGVHAKSSEECARQTVSIQYT